MALETGTYISDLVTTNPVGTDTLDKADDHLRLLKSTIKTTFPNVTGVAGIYTSGASGNIGIGVTPTVALDMVGETLIRGAAAGGSLLRVTPDTTGSNGVILDTSWITGGAGPLIFKIASVERMRIDSSGNVGIGVTTVADKLHVQGATSTYMRVTSTNAGTGAGIRFTNATGQWLIGAGPQSGLADFQFYDGNAASERMKIDSSGNVLVTGPGGLGYGTGSGGSVTQLTSKATTVTLNKTSGQITMNAAALATGTPVQFILNNSTIAATDNVVVTPNFGAAVYRAHVYSVSAGACSINVQQDSGGSRSDAVVLNFAVIKSVTA